jgi:spore coat protein CotH
MTKRLWCTLFVALLVPAGLARGQSASDMFAESMQRVDLFIHSADWSKLKQNFQTNEYYLADFRWNGISHTNAGIRSRGLGSRSGVKPGLRVDFDRYTTGGEFLGLKSIILDNLTQDQSGIHETVSMKLLARMGVPAPRETHTRLYVNDEYVGLYALVESIDKNLLARVFGTIGEDTQNDGYLFEYNYLDDWRFTYPGADFEWYKARFDAKTHENKSDADKYGPIETLVRLTNETPAASLPAAIGSLLDINAFIRFVAVQNFLAENDGFLGNWGVNNFYLYRLENRTEHVLIAWDDDNTFQGSDFAADERHTTNVLMRKLMEIPDYRALYYQILRETAESAGQDVNGISWLESEIRRQLDMIDAEMRSDPVKPYTNDNFDNEANRMKQFASQRINFVTCAVTNATGGSCQ